MTHSSSQTDAQRRSPDRTARVLVRMPAAERHAIERMAASRGLDLGAAVREALRPVITPYMEGSSRSRST